MNSLRSSRSWHGARLVLIELAWPGYAFAKLRFRGPRGACSAPARGAGDPGAGRHAAAVPDAAGRWGSSTRSIGGDACRCMAGVFGIFMVRQYALGIPDDLLDAARIDGASELPHLLARSCCRCCGRSSSRWRAFMFLSAWNDFMWPLIVLQRRAAATRCRWRSRASSGEHVQDTELMMAGSVLTVLPVLIWCSCCSSARTSAA